MLRFSSSPPFSVDQKLLLRWLRATAIIAVPALASLASSLQSGEPISL
ncbi:MAG TPA: hypothetical protein PK765_03390 [bacterium]|nr:hypothetical protein [bacterium]